MGSFPTLELTFMAAEDLKNVGMVGKLNPFAVAWVDPYSKRTSRILRKGGRNPVWNDSVTIPLDPYALANPYACLTVQVLSHGRLWDDLVGSVWLPLSEIWRLRLLRAANDDEPDVFTLQLQRPSGRLHGVVRVSICLKGVAFPPITDGAAQQEKYGAAVGAAGNYGAAAVGNGCAERPVEGVPVMGYAVPQPSTGLYYASAPYSSASTMPYAGTSASSSYPPYAYAQPPLLPPPAPPAPRRQNNNGILLGLLGGALGAILLGDLIF